MGSNSRSSREIIEEIRSNLTLAGFRHWTASLLPTLNQQHQQAQKWLATWRKSQLSN